MRKRHFLYAAGAGLFLLLACFSAEAREGAARGLALWGGILVPSLLPYFAAAGLLMRLGFTDALGRRLAGVGKSLLGVSGTGCAVFLLGLSGGYPLGAAAAAEAVREGALTPEEGSRLLTFCDNTGPAFPVGALGAAVFHSAGWGLFLWVVHALSALALGILSRGRSAQSRPRPRREKPLAPGEALSASVGAAVSALLSIGGYVVFFSALMSVTERLGFPRKAAALLSMATGAEEAVCRAALTGLLELSSGVGAMQGMAPTPEHLALGAFLLGWGGMCVHLQSVSVTAGTGMDLSRRLRGKLCHGLLSAAVAYCVSRWIL